MARNGSGVYSLPESAFTYNTVIDQAAVNSNFSDIASALTASIAADGQTTVTASLPMNSNKLTGLAVGSAATDSAHLGQIQAEAYIWCGTMTGSADAGVLTPAPAITAYAAGQRFVWMASSNVNTGAMTVAISGLSTIAAQNDGSALAAGDHAANKMYMGVLNTTSTIQIMRVSGLVDGSVTTAKIADDAVTLAKLASGTDGELITWDASGDVAAVAVGTANHTLTSNGAGAAPTFQEATTLYNSGSAKLAASSTGSAVTGTLVATTDTDTSNTGSVTLDFAANQNFVLTFTGNVTLENPTTEQVGQSGIIVCIQDGSGSRTLSLGTDYETAGGAGITLSTAASAVDIIPYFVKASGSIQLGAVQLAFA
jgi:hypothetical protein